jgi:hypothetical protein
MTARANAVASIVGRHRCGYNDWQSDGLESLGQDRTESPGAFDDDQRRLLAGPLLQPAVCSRQPGRAGSGNSACARAAPVETETSVTVWVAAWVSAPTYSYYSDTVCSERMGTHRGNAFARGRRDRRRPGTGTTSQAFNGPRPAGAGRARF